MHFVSMFQLVFVGFVTLPELMNFCLGDILKQYGRRSNKCFISP